jgi:hypothetical protein
MEAVPPGKSRYRSPTPQTRSQLRDGAIAGAFTLDRASTPYPFLLAHHIIRKRSHPALAEACYSGSCASLAGLFLPQALGRLVLAEG